MLSDDSSSDSETGRFKCRTKTQDEQGSVQKQDSFRSTGRSRYSENDRLRRDFDRKRDVRDRYDKHSRDRHRYSRHSPVHRRRHSRERSLNRKSDDRVRHRDSRGRSKPRDYRSGSKDRQKSSKSRSHKPLEMKMDLKEEIKDNIESSQKAPEKFDRKLRVNVSSSPEFKGKRSEVYIPPPSAPLKRKSDSPIIVEEPGASDLSDEVQPGSYYSMIPAVVKEKSDESTEIDSSDDEKLRAKLLNLEKELHKTRKKKHKKKHRRKSSKSSKERDTITSVEVSSTTDIQSNIKTELTSSQTETVAEVSSTQKSTQKDSSEEGEISSDDDSLDIEIDPSDLRHKLRRSGPKSDSSHEVLKSKTDVCGPALPPHLEQRFRKSASPGIEGPALPPHLQRKPKNIGPSIPEDMRKVLADREVVKYESSDEDAIGPLPAGAEDKWSEAHKHLEERALDMKIKKLEGHSLQNHRVKSREQWMLELPEGKAKYLGLEARGFRAKEGPDMSDRSSWTDTPEEKTRKAAGIVKEEDADTALKRDAKARQIASRDEEQETAVKKHKKKHKREESLLEIHQKKLKKKKKKEDKEDGKKERRPFSRDVDLQVNRFDDAQKKSIIKKSQELNTRFSSGEAKYL